MSGPRSEARTVTFPSAGETAGCPRVLVVDDDDGVRHLVHAALGAEGFDVTQAAGSAQALEALGDGTHAFDLVLTDLEMPDLHGVDLVAAIRETAPETEVVVMTGHATVESAIAALHAGAYDYVRKPFRAAEIAAVLNRALEKGRLRSMIGLYEVSREMLGSLAHPDLIDRVLRLAARVLKCDVVCLALPLPAEARLEIHRRPDGDEPAGAEIVRLHEEAVGAGATARNGPDRDAAPSVAFPLIVRGRALGSLQFWRERSKHDFSAADLRRAAVLATEAAVTLDNARLYRELEARMEELLATREQLYQSEKLAAMGRLAAGIAHEINTPTQFVGDSVRFLREGFRDLQGLLDAYGRLRDAAQDLPDPALRDSILRAEEAADLGYIAEQVPKAIERALEGIDRIVEIVRATKEFAHPDRKEKSPADLNRALEATLTVARNELKYVADVECDLGELPPVVCRLGDINQVVLNLLVNAAHAIAVAVGDSGARGKVTVRSRFDDPDAVVEIRDTGCGIPEDLRDKVFEPFFTTKEVGRGTGQGLALARTIVVDKHGGSLTFESTVGEGTTFRLRIPVAGSPPEGSGAS